MTDQDKNAIILSATRDGGMVQLNLDDMKGKVADQMRAFLLNMLPAEAFDGVIEQAFKRLTEPRAPKNDRYGKPQGSEQPSELEEMVIIEMRKQLATKVEEWGKKWKDTSAADRARDQAMSDLVDRAASGFVTRVASQIVQDSLANLATSANTTVCQCGRVVSRLRSCPDCGVYNY